jgi:hypothetical protein
MHPVNGISMRCLFRSTRSSTLSPGSRSCARRIGCEWRTLQHSKAQALARCPWSFCATVCLAGGRCVCLLVMPVHLCPRAKRASFRFLQLVRHGLVRSICAHLRFGAGTSVHMVCAPPHATLSTSHIFHQICLPFGALFGQAPSGTSERPNGRVSRLRNQRVYAQLRSTIAFTAALAESMGFLRNREGSFSISMSC